MFGTEWLNTVEIIGSIDGLIAFLIGTLFDCPDEFALPISLWYKISYLYVKNITGKKSGVSR